MLTIVDGNNWFRRRAESLSGGGSLIRSALYEIQHTTGPVVVVWDGFNARKKRRDLYPDYKVKRVKPSDDFFDIQKDFRSLLEFTRAVIIDVPEYEADDVIAHIVMDTLSSGVAHKDIFIHSNDADLWQLGVPMARNEPPISAEWMRLSKTIVGDKSDNIPGIPGFGEKAWEALDDNDKELLQAIVSSQTDFGPDYLNEKLAHCVKAKSLEWLIANLATLRTYWKVVGFFPIERSLINQHTKAGTNQMHIVESVLAKFML